MFCVKTLLSNLTLERKVLGIMFRLILLFCLFGPSLGALVKQECPGPLAPGQPGGAWSSEELRITRQKVRSFIITL